MPKETPRVSFSDRVHYSDDASTSTDSTDDEFDQLEDHTSFCLDSDDEDLLNDNESQEGEEELESDDDDDDDDNSLGMDDEDEDEDEEDNEELLGLDDDGSEAVEENMDDEDASDSDSLNDIFKDDGEEEEVSDDEEAAKSETVEAEEASADQPSKDSASFSSFDYSTIEDEKPLSFRDGGVTERPSEYLGGYGPEVYCGKPHRVKLRKSWVANANEDDEEQSEFEAWKKARAEEIAARKAARKKTQEELQRESQAEATGQNLDASETEETNREESISESLDDDVVAKAAVAKTTKANADQKPLATPKAKDNTDTNTNLETTEKQAATKASKTSTTSLKKQKKEKRASKAGNKELKKGCLKASKPAATTRRVIKPRPKDPETEAHEREMLELKETIAKLEIRLNTIEVRTISQLADLEEEIAKRMREYRAKADEIVRKQKAKNEKLALKKKAMKSQDVIAQLRKSNQKLRADGVKIQAAIDKLKQSNQALEEKSSVHFGYESEFLAFQKIEVGLAEEINKSLNQHVPHYEKLIRDMEDGVMNRVKSGHIERRAKELYEDCTDSMVDMLEQGCSDPALMDKVASLICLMDTEIQEEVVDNSHRPSLSSGRRSSALVEATANNTKVKPSSLAKALGKTAANKMDSSSQSSPTKTSARRNTTGGMKKKTSGLAKLAATEKKRSSATGHDSFRTPCKRSVVRPLPEIDDDASVFTMTSAASGKFSITDYAY